MWGKQCEPPAPQNSFPLFAGGSVGGAAEGEVRPKLHSAGVQLLQRPRVPRRRAVVVGEGCGGARAAGRGHCCCQVGHQRQLLLVRGLNVGTHEPVDHLTAGRSCQTTGVAEERVLFNIEVRRHPRQVQPVARGQRAAQPTVHKVSQKGVPSARREVEKRRDHHTHRPRLPRLPKLGLVARLENKMLLERVAPAVDCVLGRRVVQRLTQGKLRPKCGGGKRDADVGQVDLDRVTGVLDLEVRRGHARHIHLEEGRPSGLRGGGGQGDRGLQRVSTLRPGRPLRVPLPRHRVSPLLGGVVEQVHTSRCWGGWGLRLVSVLGNGRQRRSHNRDGYNPTRHFFLFFCSFFKNTLCVGCPAMSTNKVQK
eukprot:Hpha_TRINITY_DN1909_c0_g1::TRINITY_DN1909_c0_g1_i1::g.31023::m.31023